MIQHLGTRPLETERLLLRRYEMTDAEDIFANWATDPEAVRFWSWELHRDINVTRTLLEQWIREYEKSDYYSWVIVDKSDGQAIGYIYLDSVDSDEGRATVHYLISRKDWNRGFATVAE